MYKLVQLGKQTKNYNNRNNNKKGYNVEFVFEANKALAMPLDTLDKLFCNFSEIIHLLDG